MRSSNLELLEAAEARAKADFAAVVGTVIEIQWMTGYDHLDNSIDVNGPWKVRVDCANEDELTHWNDEFLDPYWNVTPVDEEMGQDSPLRGLRSFWCFGPSYRCAEEDTEPVQEDGARA